MRHAEAIEVLLRQVDAVLAASRSRCPARNWSSCRPVQIASLRPRLAGVSRAVQREQQAPDRDWRSAGNSRGRRRTSRSARRVTSCRNAETQVVERRRSAGRCSRIAAASAGNGGASRRLAVSIAVERRDRTQSSARERAFAAARRLRRRDRRPRARTGRWRRPRAATVPERASTRRESFRNDRRTRESRRIGAIREASGARSGPRAAVECRSARFLLY